MISCAEWSAVSMTFALLIGLVIHSVAGFVQLAVLPVVGVVPQNSGISVVFSGAEHWLRVYGISPHPNLLGGHLAVGVILILGLIIRSQGRQRFWLIAAWLMCWLTLLLTFSRSAWLGVAGGGLLALILLLRGRHLARSTIKLLMAIAAVSLGLTAIFVWRFQPFLVNRIEVAIVSYETQAIAQRLDAARLALQIFAAHPLTGVGLAQSVVVTRNLLGTPIDWIHNVPLLAAAELGVGGLILIGLLLIALMAIGVQRWRLRSISLWQALVGGGLIALVIAMQFDHYVWTVAAGRLVVGVAGGLVAAPQMITRRRRRRAPSLRRHAATKTARRVPARRCAVRACRSSSVASRSRPSAMSSTSSGSIRQLAPRRRSLPAMIHWTSAPVCRTPSLRRRAGRSLRTATETPARAPGCTTRANLRRARNPVVARRCPDCKSSIVLSSERILPAQLTHQDQFKIRILTMSLRKRQHEACQILARLDGADVQHKRLAQVVALPHAIEFGGVGDDVILRRGSLIDDVHFFRCATCKPATISRLACCETVMMAAARRATAGMIGRTTNWLFNGCSRACTNSDISCSVITIGTRGVQRRDGVGKVADIGPQRGQIARQHATASTPIDWESAGPPAPAMPGGVAPFSVRLASSA